MKKVNSSLRVSELDTLSDVIVRLYKDASSSESGAVAKDTNLAQMMLDVEKTSAFFTTAIKADKVKSTLNDANTKRNDVIRNLANALTGYSSIPLPEKKSAGEHLLQIFNKYGKQIASKNYAEESSLIESLLEDFSSESLADEIAALDGIAELISSLRTAQDEFNKANDAYTAAKTGKGDSATVIKKTLLSVLNDRVVYYLSAVGKVPDYKNFVSKVETEIIRANSTVNARKKSEKASA